MRYEILSKDQASPILRPQKALSSLVSLSTRYPESETLPIGAQERLKQAALFSAQMNCPIDTLLTINAMHLQRIDAGGIFSLGHLWDGLREFLEVLRKWITHRGIKWVAIWSREHAGGKHGQCGEHWHIALHLPAALRNNLAEQVAHWTDAPMGSTRARNMVARSACKSWHLRSRAPAGRGPEGLAAYLGKAEPSWVRRYGRLVPNHRKPDKWQNGGAGPIQGKRFGISKAIGATEQARATVDRITPRDRPSHYFSANDTPEVTQKAGYSSLAHQQQSKDTSTARAA